MIQALLELQFADSERAQAFRCETCPSSVKKLRRCEEDRWDFGPEDGTFWPIQITKGSGGLYGFCPGKAAKDPGVVASYEAVILTAETGALWESGGISQQPAWYMELVCTFVPMYTELRFASRARAILGDGKGTSNGTLNRQPKVHNRS